MVHIVAKNRGDGHGQQREDGEDGLGRAAHITHPAVDNQSHNSSYHQTDLSGFVLGEVAGERADSHRQHNEVLDDGHGAATPEGVRICLGEREVALQHIHCIFLERENGAVIKHAKQSHQPETAGREDLADIGNLEGIVFFLGFASLGIQFLVHKEIDDEHHQRDAKEHHTEGHGTGDFNLAAQFGEEG